MLRALTTSGLPDDLLVQWRDQPPMLAYEFFVHIASAATVRSTPRGYWGRTQRVHLHQATGSIHLIPRTGPRIIIDAPTSTYLGLDSRSDGASSLMGASVLAVATLRQARSGSLYVLVTSAAGFATIAGGGFPA